MVEVNGQLGALVFGALGVVTAVVTLEINDGCVQTLRNVVNPDKLRHLARAPELPVR